MVGARMEARLENVKRALEHVERTVGELQGFGRTVNEIQRAHVEGREERAAMQCMILQLQEQNANILALLQTNQTQPTGNVGHERQNTNEIVPVTEGERPQNGLETRGVEGERQNEAMKQNVGGDKETEEVGDKDVQRYRKLEMPLFEGEDPIGWTFRMEQYFAINRVLESERLDATVVGLEGRAVNWFQWTEMRAPIANWKDSKAVVIERFHCSPNEDMYEWLAGLKQEGLISEFRERFELLLATLEDMSEEALMGMFLNGLKDEVKADVQLLKPKTKEIMDTTFQVEGRNTMLQKVKDEKRDRSNKVGGSLRWPMVKPTYSKFLNLLEASKNSV